MKRATRDMVMLARQHIDAGKAASKHRAALMMAAFEEQLARDFRAGDSQALAAMDRAVDAACHRLRDELVEKGREDADLGLVPLRAARREARQAANEEGVPVTMRDPISDAVIATVRPTRT